ncbi:MAG: hypothetical protein GY786_17660 [Proteobacteria bacterium]|nr:hypothetical protein [Pseudomonadota bacterium]
MSVLPPPSADIPENALWVGGPDGGVFVLVKKSNCGNSGIYDAEIYYNSGSLDYKGKLVINTPENPEFVVDDVNSYGGWDGDRLFLQNGRYLETMSNLLNTKKTECIEKP